jgi:predicted flap endonuclease-1-like 5' DNA nuclease
MRAVPAPIPAPIPVKAAEGADDLRKIKGVGPKLAALLQEMGVTRFAQIAAWSDADIDAIDAKLGRFQGRIRRDDWVAQASLLDAQDLAAYEERFGNT